VRLVHTVAPPASRRCTALGLTLLTRVHVLLVVPIRSPLALPVMRLLAGRKINRYLKDIERDAHSLARAQPKGSREGAFYLGVVLAARQQSGAEAKPTNRQAWLDSVLPSIAHGWIFAAEQMARSTERWDPTFQFVLPLPEETKLYDLGERRTSKTIWNDSIYELDFALVLLDRGPSDFEQRDEVITRLDNAQAGFAHLWTRMTWEDSDVGRSLAAQCRCLILTVAAGDPARLREEQDKAAALLATAKGSSPHWNWSVDNDP
jgi:hypothetical protein